MKINKKAVAPLVIFGIPIGVILWILISFLIVDPVIDDILDQLGQDVVCTSEYYNESFNLCFDKEGGVIVDGKVSDSLSVQIEPSTDICYIQIGDYDLEYVGCKLSGFKQIGMYNLVVISNKGRIIIKGEEILNKVAMGVGVTKYNPTKIKWIKRLSYLLKL